MTTRRELLTYLVDRMGVPLPVATDAPVVSPALAQGAMVMTAADVKQLLTEHPDVAVAVVAAGVRHVTLADPEGRIHTVRAIDG